MGTREARSVPYVEKVCSAKTDKIKVLQTAPRESDQFVVVTKQGNACGAKGPAGKSSSGGVTFSVLRDGTERRFLLDVTRAIGGETFLKSRMWETYKSGSVRGLIVSSREFNIQGRWL
jgi:hypothetical protein